MSSFHQKGFVAILASVLLVITMIMVAVTIANLVIVEQEIAMLASQSAQAYLAAESGIEDAVLRIRRGFNLPSSYSFVVGEALANVQVSDPIGGSRTITVQGDQREVSKKIEAVHSFGGDGIDFYFGAQVGDGGLLMAPNTLIDGNVFSNGSITGSGIGSSVISGSVAVVGTSHKLEDVSVGQDARVHLSSNSAIANDLYVHTCNNSSVGNDLYYAAGGSRNNCPPVGDEFEASPEDIYPDSQSFPISDEQIDGWRADAAEGGVYGGDYFVAEAESFGPLQINGNLGLDNNAVLTLTGTVYVTGNVSFGNGAIVQLDQSSYGFNSGTLVVDGKVEFSPNVVIQGNGLEGSYLLIVSTYSSADQNDPAINVENNADTGIFFANNGFINIANNVGVKEVTAYGLKLNNNASINYEIGLASLLFSSGPGGGWQIESWREVE